MASEPTIKVMTPDEFAEEAKKILLPLGDPEGKHHDTDDLMEDLLVSLGYGEGVTIIRDSTRWYA